MTVDSQLVSSIGRGVLVFAAVDRDDTPKEVESMAGKVLKMKMWPDDSGGPVRGPLLFPNIYVSYCNSGNIVSKISTVKCSVVRRVAGSIDASLTLPHSISIHIARFH